MEVHPLEIAMVQCHCPGCGMLMTFDEEELGLEFECVGCSYGFVAIAGEPRSNDAVQVASPTGGAVPHVKSDLQTKLRVVAAVCIASLVSLGGAVLLWLFSRP